MTGTLRLAISKSSRPMSRPARRACAIRWMIALVEQPIAIATAIAFSNALRVWIVFGVKSSQTISTMRRPHSEAMRIWFASAAGNSGGPRGGHSGGSAVAVLVVDPALDIAGPETPPEPALTLD